MWGASRMKRVGHDRWSERKEKLFLRAGGDGTVSRAAAAAGMSPNAVYQRRMRDAHLKREMGGGAGDRDGPARASAFTPGLPRASFCLVIQGVDASFVGGGVSVMKRHALLWAAAGAVTTSA